ncbi:Phosphotransferase [Pyrenophora tritici-repentis]|nr:Phosphotransferase [Pyrenophora tritici-repentis]KAI2480263.1 Phosphotransferase [Pyrenophora tritici-repentis]
MIKDSTSEYVYFVLYSRPVSRIKPLSETQIEEVHMPTVVLFLNPSKFKFIQ